MSPTYTVTAARPGRALKTMLLPILFLLGFIKVCKGVWGIDLTGLTAPLRAPRVN